MNSKTSQALFAYWNEVRRDRLAPRRFEIEPSQIVGILPHTFILERVDSETFRYRLAGTALCDAFGQEFRDTNFLAGWHGDDADAIERLLAAVTQHGAVGVLSVEAMAVGRPAVAFEILILPLVHTRDTIDRLLGAATPLEMPDWLGSEPLTTRRLTASTLVWPTGTSAVVENAVQRQEPFFPHVRKARIVRSERRQFRVYDGGLTKGGGT